MSHCWATPPPGPSVSTITCRYLRLSFRKLFETIAKKKFISNKLKKKAALNWTFNIFRLFFQSECRIFDICTVCYPISMPICLVFTIQRIQVCELSVTVLRCFRFCCYYFCEHHFGFYSYVIKVEITISVFLFCYTGREVNNMEISFYCFL